MENPRYIQTISSRGYRFIAPVQVEDQPTQEGGRIRLAVLPFETAEQAQIASHFSEALVGEIITHLGHLDAQRLGVIARTSILKYRRLRGESVAQIGRELNVDYILEGSVWIFNEHIHITIRLIQVKDQTCRWTRYFDYTSGDPITIQKEVAQRIAHTLGLELLEATEFR